LKTLILGMGNELLGDEGVGVHAVRALRAESLPAGVAALEAGTANLDVLPALEASQRLIIIDAMQGQGAAGSIYRTPLKDCRDSALIAALHGFDIFRMLTTQSVRRDLERIVIFGIEPEVIKWSPTLSPVVQGAIPHLLDALRDELRND
jgi:hydrogenase maturation protease